MKNRFLVFLIVLVLLLFIPFVGLLVSHLIEGKYEANFVQYITSNFNISNEQIKLTGMTLEKVCKNETTFSMCSSKNDLDLLKIASILSIIFGFGLVFFVILARKIIGLNRKILALLFSPITILTMFGLSLSIVVQGGILIFCIYISEVVYLDLYHPKLIFVLALSTIITAYIIISSGFSSLKNNTTEIIGEKITNKNGQDLIDFINDIAEKIDARAPDNIILGLEPTFYVTAVNVSLKKETKKLVGTTMYLPLPFLSILSKEELSSVIGHELGHFKGEDTFYAMRFYPSYFRLYKAINDINKNQSFIGLPALATLNFVLNEFSITECSIGRTREFEADKVGASVASSLSLIIALLKLIEFSVVWDELRLINIQQLNEGIFNNDMSVLYCALSDHIYKDLDFDKTVQVLLSSQISHLTDTHPTIKERMEALKIDYNALTKELLKPANSDLTDYLSQYKSLDYSLSIREHRLMIDLGIAVLPPKIE